MFLTAQSPLKLPYMQRRRPDTFSDQYYFCTLYNCVVAMGISPMGKFGLLSVSPRKTSCKSRATQPYLIKVHAGSFHVSVIHWTLTQTTGSVTCVRDHSYACVYTQGGWAHQQRVSTTFLTRKKLWFFVYCAPDADGVWTSGLWISSWTLYQLSHPATRGTDKLVQAFHTAKTLISIEKNACSIDLI